MTLGRFFVPFSLPNCVFQRNSGKTISYQCSEISEFHSSSLGSLIIAFLKYVGSIMYFKGFIPTYSIKILHFFSQTPCYSNL